MSPEAIPPLVILSVEPLLELAVVPLLYVPIVTLFGEPPIETDIYSVTSIGLGKSKTLPKC